MLKYKKLVPLQNSCTGGLPAILIPLPPTSTIANNISVNFILNILIKSPRGALIPLPPGNFCCAGVFHPLHQSALQYFADLALVSPYSAGCAVTHLGAIIFSYQFDGQTQVDYIREGCSISYSNPLTPNQRGSIYSSVLLSTSSLLLSTPR